MNVYGKSELRGEEGGVLEEEQLAMNPPPADAKRTEACQSHWILLPVLARHASLWLKAEFGELRKVGGAKRNVTRPRHVARA